MLLLQRVFDLQFDRHLILTRRRLAEIAGTHQLHHELVSPKQTSNKIKKRERLPEPEIDSYISIFRRIDRLISFLKTLTTKVPDFREVLELLTLPNKGGGGEVIDGDHVGISHVLYCICGVWNDETTHVIKLFGRTRDGNGKDRVNGLKYHIRTFFYFSSPYPSHFL